MEPYFAVIDTETNFNDEVMTLGAVIARADAMVPAERLYLLIDPEYRVPGFYSNRILLGRAPVSGVCSRAQAVRRLRELLKKYGVTEIFAYNARFDRGHLPEMHGYRWFDIMKVAAYRQYNRGIGVQECCSTGRLKYHYSAQDIYRLLCPRGCYSETHNALADAEDELEIMRMLAQPLSVYGEKAGI